MRLFKTAALAILGSLALLGGCEQLPTDIPDPYGVQGFLSLGWEAYGEHDFETALDYFQDAIDVDVKGIESYLAAGFSTLFLDRYWRMAQDYFWMAFQNDGNPYLLQELSAELVQDTMWTKFQCLHPDLPPEVLNPILAMTADSGAIWVGEQIRDIIGTDPIPYRFMVDGQNPVAMFKLFNNFSMADIPVDSIVTAGDEIWVHVLAPYVRADIEGDRYRNWINADNIMTFNYVHFNPPADHESHQYTLDALAGITMLQHLRGETGSPLFAVGAARAVSLIEPAYAFGYGRDYSGREAIDNVRLMGMAAAIAFAEQNFRFAWFICLSEDFGAGLDPESPDFEVALMLVIEQMLL